jgi:hypothetical protein
MNDKVNLYWSPDPTIWNILQPSRDAGYYTSVDLNKGKYKILSTFCSAWTFSRPQSLDFKFEAEGEYNEKDGIVTFEGGNLLITSSSKFDGQKCVGTTITKTTKFGPHDFRVEFFNGKVKLSHVSGDNVPFEFSQFFEN